MRWLVSTCLPVVLTFVAPSVAFAWGVPKNDTESKLLYDRFAKDFAANPYLHNKNMNLLRDGKRSAYLETGDKFAEQADDVPADVMKILPDAKWISFAIFNQAIRGMRQILANFPTGIRDDLLTIVDFGLKTEARRFLVLDLQREKILFQTWTHHGRKSDANGDRFAEQFSNVVDSNKSSVGFLLASDNPYEGMWGYSLRMHGIDGALNSNVHQRAMVLHPWPTIHPRELSKLNPIVQSSLGCLSLPFYESGKFYGLDDQPLSKLIIDTIKKRSVIFVSTPQIDLEHKSIWLKSTALLPAAQRAAIIAKVDAESAGQPSLSGGEEAREVVPAEYRSWMKR
ncbi:MAG: murein L,D-transpeptidase catalytic domain family protein [Bdellovibrionales bacterium]|nr:murein L,D-transpeptidase catalytic domain family protein [Bdellovibrionales bacterium]